MLEFCILWCSWEGDDIADVLHSRNEEDKALETETEACMRTRTPTTGVHVPPQVGSIHLTTLHLSASCRTT